MHTAARPIQRRAKPPLCPPRHGSTAKSCDEVDSGRAARASLLDMARPALALLLLLPACPPDSSESSTTTSTTTASPTTTTVEPTTGDPNPLQRCTPHCERDADCRVNGMDIGFACIAGVCGVPPCSDDAGCRARLSGWTIACGDPDDCSPLTVCIDLGAGAGACAYEPGPDLVCSDLGLDELSAPAIAGGEVVVCGDANAACVDQACVSACTADSDCVPEQGTPVCEISSGRCQCTSDQDCLATGKPGLVACVAGRCGCEVDADCQGGANVDVCRAGACGCSSTRACTESVFDDVTALCEPT